MYPSSAHGTPSLGDVTGEQLPFWLVREGAPLVLASPARSSRWLHALVVAAVLAMTSAGALAAGHALAWCLGDWR